MLALHEMMKMQLQLVQNFVDIQRRMYQSCKDGLKYDHKYTTLEDTKEVSKFSVDQTTTSHNWPEAADKRQRKTEATAET